MDNVKVKVS